MDRKSLPPLKTLPAFVATAQHLSFSKAAGSLFVAHLAELKHITLEALPHVCT